MSKQKAKYKLYIFGVKKWRLHSCQDSFQAANTLAHYFKSLSYKVQIRQKGKVVCMRKAVKIVADV